MLFHNYTLSELKDFMKPLLVQRSMPKTRLTSTVFLAGYSLERDSTILRVHPENKSASWTKGSYVHVSNCIFFLQHHPFREAWHCSRGFYWISCRAQEHKSEICASPSCPQCCIQAPHTEALHYYRTNLTVIKCSLEVRYIFSTGNK